ncbi:MAG: helix-turn-helix transcriptional regulator [Prevotella sp.]|nr:helix-turn-helix transcriptional regulator [Prevotella sp.]
MEKSIHLSQYHVMISLLREKRESVNVTQVQLADKLNVGQTIISKIETCERRIDVIELMSICDALNIAFPEFIDELIQKLK